MEYIRFKESGDKKDTAKIILNKNKITIKAKDYNMAIFLRELIDKWKLDYDMKDVEVFKKIPVLSSHYSRIFFSNIIKG